MRVVMFLFGLSALTAQTTNLLRPQPVGRLVDIGGRKLHLDCIGQGNPTVILVHGAGAFSFDWGLVQPRVGTFARVCSYDRAGTAWSDPVSAPQTLHEMSGDLHELMRKAGETGPFVLVGHSLGGELVRVFAAGWPGDVAGAVLVDTGHPDALSIINGRLVRRTAENLIGVPPPVKSGDPAPQPAPEPVRIEKIEPPFDKLPVGDQRFRLWAVSSGKVSPSGAKAEVESVQELRAAHERGDALFGDKSLVVISRATGGYRPIRGVVSQEQADLLERERIEHNRDLLELSRNSKAIVADKSGHDIHLDQPELVIESIRAVRDAIRSHSHLN
jgi:pimeloyl-ACP methyl ester carboxylesterase